MEWIADHKIDTLEQKIDFFKSESIFATPALPLALRANAELIDQKMAIGAVIKNKHKIIWAQVGQVTVGGLCYTYEKFNTAVIVLSFTDPKYRRLGIHLLCKQHFENECRNKNIKYITTSVHVDNTTAFDNNQKVGMKPVVTT